MSADDLGARLALHSVGRRPPVTLQGGEHDVHRGELRLHMAGVDGGHFTLVVAPAKEGQRSYRRAGALALSYRDSGHTRLIESYVTFLTRSLASLPFADLVAWVEERFPAAPVDPLARPVAHVRQGEPYSLGRPDGWARFFSVAHRGLGESVRFRHRLAGLQHQDPECLVFPEVFARPLKLIKYPWATRERWPLQRYTPPEGAAADDGAAVRTWTTQMGEREVILGGSQPLREGLEALAEDPWPELVSVAFTCTPQVIGDDLPAALRAFGRKSCRPLLHLQDEREHPARPVVRLLREAIARGGPGQALAHRFNLVGFRPGDLRWELAALAGLGGELGVALLPDIHLGEAERFLDAGLQVLGDQGWLARFTEELFSTLPVPAMTAALPLGWRASEEWAAGVAARLAPGGWDGALWADATRRERWEKLRGRVAGARLGFVLAEGALAELLDGGRTQRLPLVAALREMGFGLDFLLAEGLDAGGLVPEDRVLRFDRPSSLREALLRSEARAFYTEYNYDWRLTSTGKAAFSFHDLKFGGQGALDNLRWLLSVGGGGFAARCAPTQEDGARWQRLEREIG